MVANENQEDQKQNDEEEMYVEEEQMLDIAENCFVNIGEHLLSKNVSVKEAFIQ